MEYKRCLEEVFADFADEFDNGEVTVHSRNYCGSTLLHLVCEVDDLESAKLLIEAGADINALDGLKESCVHLAVKYGRPELLQYLLENGASLDVSGSDDDRPLHIAARRGVEYVRLLVGAGADVNAKGDRGFTPLHIAAMRGDDAMVTLLLHYGAVLQTNMDGMTALSVAAHRFAVYERICEELRKQTT